MLNTPRKHSTRVFSVLGVACLGAALCSCGKPPARQPPPPPPVAVAPVETRSVQKTAEWIARLDGSVNVDIRARVSGYISEILFREGAEVKAGDVLLKIDPRPFEAALAQAQAGLAKAKANLGKTEADEKRQQQLFQTRAGSQQDLDNAVQANLASKAAVAAAEAEVLQARLNLEFATLVSPIDGIAGGRNLSAGEFLNAGSSGAPVTTISKTDPVKVSFGLTEKEYLAFAPAIAEHLKKPEPERERAAVLIRADGTEHPHKGWLVSVDRAVSPETGTIAASALFPNPGNLLRPGQFARIRFTAPQAEQAVVVPPQAVVDLQGRTFVWVVDAQNIARMRPVAAGRATPEGRVITEGLAEGERVIIEGVHRAADGRPVTPVPPPGRAGQAPGQPSPQERGAAAPAGR